MLHYSIFSPIIPGSTEYLQIQEQSSVVILRG